MITFNDFKKVDIRLGKIIAAELLPNAKYSTNKLTIDFGKEIGVKTSCARVINYKINDLIGKLILAVINFPPKQIGKNMSEVLILGLPDKENECILLSPDKNYIELGVKVY